MPAEDELDPESSSVSEDRRDQIDAVAEQYLAMLRSGVEVEIDEMVSKHPELGAELELSLIHI